VKPLDSVPESTDIGADLLKLMASPALASRRWISEQYDSQVGADTLQTGGDAGVVRVHGTKKALAITTDCTPRYVYADPYEGGKQAIAEAYRNLCAVGARPLAVTNCLNFANPQRPEIMSQFVHALEGMGDACRALDFPIVSGNVSLYNESKATGGGSAILPTPAIGGVGIIDDAATMVTPAFKAAGDAIYLIAPEFWAKPDPTRSHLGKSLWLKEVHGRDEGRAPPVNLEAERGAGQIVRKLTSEGLLSAVHDLSDGGLAVALAEMAMSGGVGAEVSANDAYTTAQWWFGEDQARYVITVSPDHAEAFNRIVAEGPEIPEAEMVGFHRIGTVGGESVLGASLDDLRHAHESFFKEWMEG
ncbi:AIR synthase related protein, partial [uncultured Erythrobacter sp.]|uniref:AIR synthase related protein n=1 Tax=uncultured Erythrobacter sp. TaxID=263913 RepID=UPI00261BABA7